MPRGLLDRSVRALVRRHVERYGGTASRLLVIRKALGLLQREVADLAGVSQAAVSRWEHNHDRPSPRTARRLAKSLGVRVEEL